MAEWGEVGCYIQGLLFLEGNPRSQILNSELLALALATFFFFEFWNSKKHVKLLGAQKPYEIQTPFDQVEEPWQLGGHR